MKTVYVIILVLLVVLMLLLLTSSALALAGVLWLREIALTSVASARTAIPDIGEETFSYTLEVEQEIPVAASIPINENITVPVHTTVPISTVLTVPIDAGLLGTFDINVPVQTIIPVDIEFSVPIRKTISFSTTVNLDVDVPIEIPLAETQLPHYIEQLDTALERLERELEDPLSSREVDVRPVEE